MGLFIDLLATEKCVLGKGALASDIEKAETKLGLRFSDEYRQYLLKYGVASVGSREFTGICGINRLNVVEATLKNREYVKTVPQNLYVIEELDIDSIVIWQSETGEVFMTDGLGRLSKIADSMYEYFKS